MRKALMILGIGLMFLNPATAKVMGQNTEKLPSGCEEISGTANITVKAGTEYTDEFPGKMYTYNNRTLQFAPCTKLTVTFINNDSIRHQWMVHGLSKDLYPMGMFMLEVTGQGKETGTFILPAKDESLLIHCGVSQHMQKGMKAQLTVGEGDGVISNIPGYSAALEEYQYDQKSAVPMGVVVAILMMVLGAGIIWAIDRKTSLL